LSVFARSGLIAASLMYPALSLALFRGISDRQLTHTRARKYTHTHTHFLFIFIPIHTWVHACMHKFIYVYSIRIYS